MKSKNFMRFTVFYIQKKFNRSLCQCEWKRFTNKLKHWFEYYIWILWIQIIILLLVLIDTDTKLSCEKYKVTIWKYKSSPFLSSPCRYARCELRSFVKTIGPYDLCKFLAAQCGLLFHRLLSWFQCLNILIMNYYSHYFVNFK